MAYSFTGSCYLLCYTIIGACSHLLIYLVSTIGSISFTFGQKSDFTSFSQTGKASQTTSAFLSILSYFSTSFVTIFLSDLANLVKGLKYFLKDILLTLIPPPPIQHEQFPVLYLYIHRMTKFFIPIPRGAPKGFAHPPKQKKGGSCVATLQKKVVQVLKKLLTREIQKTIRKLHEKEQGEAGSGSSREGLVSRLEKLKQAGKAQLKQLSLFIMQQELNVEANNIKKLFQIVPPQDAASLSEPLRLFYDTIKGRNLYRGEIEDAQKIRNTVVEKKKIKKEKAKLKKKTKVAVRKEKGEEKVEEKQSMDQEMDKEEKAESEAEAQLEHQSEADDHSESPVRQARPTREHFKTRLDSEKPHQKTEFKKTGRNKYLQEKRNQKKGIPPPIPQKAPSAPSAIPGRHETPHPSWQAKRQIKNQMFLQPFQGKRTIL